MQSSGFYDSAIRFRNREHDSRDREVIRRRKSVHSAGVGCITVSFREAKTEIPLAPRRDIPVHTQGYTRSFWGESKEREHGGI